MSVNKVDLEFLEIKNRLNSIDLPIVDLIVGIAEGGKVPASLIAWILEIPLLIIKINYRDDNNKPRYEIPMLLKDINIPANVKKILLVDDVGVSGKTLKLQLGYSHDIDYVVPKEVKIECPKQNIIKLSSYNKEILGATAAKIRSYRKPEPFKGKGIKYDDEFIFRKEGKKK